MTAVSLPLPANSPTRIALAIRTPELFEQAVSRTAFLLSRLKQEGPDATCEELETLAKAIADAPFRMRDGKVTAKGFTPRFAK